MTPFRSVLSNFKSWVVRTIRILKYGDDLTFAWFEAETPEILPPQGKTSRFTRIWVYLKDAVRAFRLAHACFIKENQFLIPDHLDGPFAQKAVKVFITDSFKNAVSISENESGEIALPLEHNAPGFYLFIGRQLQNLDQGRLEISLHRNGKSKPVLIKKVYSLRKNWNLFHVALGPENQDLSGPDTRLSWKTTKASRGLFLSRPITQNIRPPRRLIILIADAVRPGDLGLYCQDRPSLTPTIDSFFSQGVAFRNSFSQSNWTLPTFASMALSQYASHHNVVDPNLKLRPMDRSIPTLAELLHQDGFFTYGSVSHQRSNHTMGHHRGFDHFRYQPAIESKEGSVGSKGLTDMTLQIRELCSYLRNLRHVDFFGFVHLFDTHFPYFDNTPLHLNDAFLLFEESLHHHLHRSFRDSISPEERALIINRYHSKLVELDYLLGELFHLLDSMENTTVILTSDHGYTFEKRKTNTLDNEEVKTPFLIRSNQFKLDKKGAAERFVESSIDLLPTITELYGIADPTARQGKPLFNQTGAIIPKNHAFSELVYLKRYLLKVFTADTVALFESTRNRETFAIDVENLKIKEIQGEPTNLINIFSQTGLASPIKEKSLKNIALLSSHPAA